MLLSCIALVVLLGTDLRADADFLRGKSQIEAFEYEAAAATFEALARRPGLAAKDRAVALMWLGVVASELRQQQRASRAFDDAVAADPSVVIPEEVSPKIRAELEAARARAAAKAPQPSPQPSPQTSPQTSRQDGGRDVSPDVQIDGAAGEEDSESLLSAIGVGTLVAGAAVAAVGGVVWGYGLVQRQQAADEPFQSDAAKLRDQSILSQIGGQITTAAGGGLVAAGGLLFWLGMPPEVSAPGDALSRSP